MSDTIMETVKKAIGVPPVVTDFDDVIQMHINAALGTMYQLATFDSPVYLETGDEQWTDITSSSQQLSLVQEYVSLKTRMAFDPPQSGSYSTALDDRIAELEFRINVEGDPTAE